MTNKEIILEKSRRDNSKGDEREKHIKILQEKWAIIGAILCMFILGINNLVRGEDVYVFICIILAGALGEISLRLYKNRNLTNAILFALILGWCVQGIICYIMGARLCIDFSGIWGVI